jgi:hypothetical protein
VRQNERENAYDAFNRRAKALILDLGMTMQSAVKLLSIHSEKGLLEANSLPEASGTAFFVAPKILLTALHNLFSEPGSKAVPSTLKWRFRGNNLKIHANGKKAFGI